MRLVDADKLKVHFPKDEDWDYPVNTNSEVVRIIDEAPTVDAVEVVRCKDCVYYEAGGCRAKETIVIESEFCSWGERKEDANS